MLYPNRTLEALDAGLIHAEDKVNPAEGGSHFKVLNTTDLVGAGCVFAQGVGEGVRKALL